MFFHIIHTVTWPVTCITGVTCIIHQIEESSVSYETKNIMVMPAIPVM